MLVSNTAVLNTPDVPESAAWYHHVLGFEIAWIWTPEDPGFGCVQRNGQSVFLSRHPEPVQGHSHSFGVDDIDALYAEHQARNATIVEPIDDKPWGIREYIVQSPHGYRLRFSGSKLKRAGTAASLPERLRIEARPPSVEEYLAIEDAVNPESQHPDVVEKVSAMFCGSVAFLDDRPVGMACAVGDGLTVVYVHSVGVHPEIQGRGVGSVLMERLMDSLRQRCSSGTPIILLTGKPAFYAPFGFRPEGGLMIAKV